MAVDRPGSAESFQMERISLRHQIIAFLLPALLYPSVLLSQSDSIHGSGRMSAIPAKIADKKHSLYAGIGGGNNLIYLGSSISDNKPFYSGSVSYGYKNAMFASVSATHLSGLSPFPAFYNFSVNFSHTFNSWLDISSDAAVYKSAKALKDSLFSDFAYLNITTGFDWRLLYTRISFSGLFSEERGFYCQISNSRYFQTGEFFRGKAMVYFNPDMDFLIGKLFTVENPTGSKNYGKAPPFSHSRKKTPGTSEVITEKLGPIDLMFNFPVTFNYGNVSVEAVPGYILPLHCNSYYTEPDGFSFYLNIIYKIL